MRDAVLLLLVVFPAARAIAEEAAGAGAGPIPPSVTVATAGTSGPTSAARSAASVEETRYAGTYVYIGGPSERSVVKAAIDRATEGMFGKVIAREELMKR